MIDRRLYKDHGGEGSSIPYEEGVWPRTCTDSDMEGLGAPLRCLA